MSIGALGYRVFDPDPAVLAWADAARQAADPILKDSDQQKVWLRHGGTWFVGVDALPSDSTGAIKGVPLSGAWRAYVALPEPLHPAQLSVVYPGYPRQDPTASDAAHRYRIKRCAAHVDGLLPDGGRRFPREPHALIVGLPLTEVEESPLMVWEGSHLPMRAALASLIGGRDPREVDVTEVYTATRAKVFETCKAVPVRAKPGQVIVLDRHLVHGIAPWGQGETDDTPRMVAYFRPLCADPMDWVRGP